ncbi:hypothetical protein AB4Z01_28955 [Inquilinus sp. YAF38]|uniref:hypothetical protein n=1 Tax=Inquilinus sp. YAF38 TaxID=3233084 RepID=UPI003F932020
MTSIFDTRSQAQLATIPAAGTVSVNGYSSPGDGGAAVYKQIPAPTPARAWHFQSADGAWWELAETTVRPQQFGASGTGNVDAAPGIQDFLDYLGWCKDNERNASGEMAGVFLVKSTVRLPRPFLEIDCRAVIHAAGDGTFTAIPLWTGEASPVKCVIDTYRGRQSVISGHIEFRCDAGTGLTPIGNSQGIFPLDGAPGLDGQGASNITWGTLDVQSYDYGLYTPGTGLGWTAGAAYSNNNIVLFGRRIFQAQGSGTASVEPVYAKNKINNLEFVHDRPLETLPVGSPMVAGAIYQWQPSLPVVSGAYVVNGNNTYRVTDPGTLSTTPPAHQGIAHTPPGADGISWKYLRLQNYSATWVGAFVEKWFIRGAKNGMVASQTACDDSVFPAVRIMESREEAFLVNGGFLNIDSLFISPSAVAAKYKNANAGFDISNAGSAWGQNFGAFLCGSAYVAGEWANGLILGQASTTAITNLEPDADYKSARGCFVEIHPSATRVTANLGTLSENANTTVKNNDYLILTGTAVPSNGSVLTWSGGSAYILEHIKDNVVPANPFRVVLRIIGGTLPTSGTVTSGASTWTVQPKSYDNLILSGVVGVPLLTTPYPGGVDAVTRNVDIKIPFKAGTAAAFAFSRPLPVAGQVVSQDSLIARTLDRPEGVVYAVRSSALTQMFPEGLRLLPAAAVDTQILLEDGLYQEAVISGHQLVLPSNTDGTAGFDKVFSPTGARLVIDTLNGGTVSGGNPFFTDGQHQITWVGRQPTFPVSGRTRHKLVSRDGKVWLGEGGINPAPYTVSFVAAPTGVTLNGYNAVNFEITLTGNLTLNNPVSIQPGMEFTILLIQGPGGGFTTLTRGSAWKVPGGSLALSAAAGQKDLLRCLVRTSGASPEILVTPFLNIS